MRNVRLSLTLAVVVVIAAGLVSFAGGRVGMPPEQGELERFLGTWNIHTTMYPAVWTPEEITHQSTYTSEWILGGQCVQQSSQDYLKIYKYDPGERVYRYWFFDSSGIAVAAIGHWGEEAKSFVWSCSAGPGLTTTVTHHFVDSDTIDLTIRIEDRSGKVYYHSESQSTRQ